jgi:thymidylate synthase
MIKKNRHYEDDNFDEVYSRILGTLLSDGAPTATNRSGDTITELINPSFELSNPRYCFATCRGMSFPYLKGELEFYLSGSPLLRDIACHSKFWERCTDDGVTINSNYGKLLLYDVNKSGYTQFQYALEMLLRNPESKKAVMTIYAPSNAYVSNDNPCTMYLQFFIREGRLNLYVKMRSSDVWFGLPYDVPFFVLVMVLMRMCLAVNGVYVELGEYNHNSGSLHLYERNFSQARKVWEKPMIHRRSDEELFDEYILGAIDSIPKNSIIGMLLHDPYHS